MSNVALKQSPSKIMPADPVLSFDTFGKNSITGGEILINALIEEGVDTVFGYPGGVVLGLYDKLYKKNAFRHILVNHEQCGTHAADAYARVTGKPGVVLVTSGPGATNTVTGIANAYMDSIPLVVFTGQVHSDMIGNDAFQEADIIGITRPITKHSFLVKDTADLKRIIHEGFHIATTGRPGPVLIDMPKDMLNGATAHKQSREIKLRGYDPLPDPDISQMEKILSELERSKRPLIYAGGGIVLDRASEELRKFAVKCGIPVATTLMGLGTFPETHELSLGMLGMHGTWCANMAASECDLLIVLGARFDDRVTGRLDGFSLKSTKVHVDIDPSCIGKNVAADIAVTGSVREVLTYLNSRVSENSFEDWMNQLNTWKQEHPLKYEQSAEEIKPQYVIEQISDITRSEAIVVTDVGQHQMWTAQYYKFKHSRSFVTSGGLGTMGYGVPAAIGAALGNPGRKVFCICGDGGFKMTANELATAVAYNLPIKIAVINNGYLGMVRQWQELFFGGRYSQSSIAEKSPDFVQLAKSFGAEAYRAQKPDEVKDVLKNAMEVTDRPVVLDFIVSGTENVYPIVPPGAAINEMVEGS